MTRFFSILLSTLLFAATALGGPHKKSAHTLAWYSAHYKAHNDLASLKAITRHIKIGWKLRQARALLGEGVDMGYGGYRYSAAHTYVGLELTIEPTSDGKDTIITAKTVMEMRE